MKEESAKERNKWVLDQDIGECFTREDFKQYCIDNWFIDDDGFGYYLDQDYGRTHIVCKPSEIANGIEHPYPYVVWYNE